MDVGEVTATFHDGPFERLVNIHWPPGLIGALQFSYSLTGPADVAFLASLNSPGFGISGKNLAALAPVALPPKIATAKDYWTYAPKISNVVTPSGATYTVIDSALYNIATNLGVIVSGDGRPGNPYRYASGALVSMANPFFGTAVPLSTADIAAIGNIDNYITDFVAFAENGMLYAGLVVSRVISSHTSTTTYTTYTKTGKIIVFFSLKKSKSLPLVITVATSGAPSNTMENWSATFLTFKKTKTFPVDINNILSGVPGLGDPVDGKIITSGIHAETITPPFLTTFNINLTTLAVTASKA